LSLNIEKFKKNTSMTNSKTKKQKEEELLLLILKDLWNYNNKNPFKIAAIKIKLIELKMDRALTTYMIGCGLLKKTQWANCVFMHKPSKLWVDKIISEKIKRRYLYNQNQKKTMQLPLFHNDLKPIESNSHKQLESKDVEQSILLLKSLGYKILKPIEPQYKEI